MQKRITIFDTVRGFTMISMAGFQGLPRSRLPVRLGYALVYPDRLSRRLARQHQLGIFVYRGLDVHPFAQQYQTCRKIRLSSTRRLAATTLVSVDDSVNFGIIYCMAACTGIVALTHPSLRRFRRDGACPYALCCLPSPGASPKRSTLSPTWRGWDFQALGLSQVITTPSSRLSLCILQDTSPHI